MNRKLREIQQNTEGSIILETSLVLPIFILFIFAIYGFFSIVSTQQRMSHALIQSTKSLSLDSYAIENAENITETIGLLKGWGDAVTGFFGIASDNAKFYSYEAWYEEDDIDGVAEERFIAYLAGGDEDAYEDLLDDMKVSDLKFETSVDGEDLTVTIKYNIQYWFDAFDLGKIPMEQSITCRMWMNE